MRVEGVVAAATGLVFALAVAGKLMRRREWHRLARGILRRPASARALAVALPAAEAAVAVVVLLRPEAGLWLAAGLLAGMAAAVLLLGRRLSGAPCNCFGSLLPGTLGGALAVRNLILAATCGAAAALALEGGTGGDPARPGEVAVAAGLVLCGVGIARLRRAPGRGARGIRIGASASIDGLQPGRSALVLMLAPGCPPCEAMAGRVDQLARAAGAEQHVVVIAGGASAHARADLARRVGPSARLDLGALFARWEVHATPLAVVVDRRGRIQRVGHPEDLASDARQAVPDALGPPALASRRELLIGAARAAAALVLAGTMTRAGGRAWAAAPPADDPNLVKGGCAEFGEHARDKGLYYDRYGGSARKYEKGTLGYTHVWPQGSAEVVASHAVLKERVRRDIDAVCDCPAKPTRFYHGPTAVTRCAQECQSGGLACSHWQCKVGPELVCVTQVIRVTVSLPDLAVTRLRRQPPPSSTAACRRLARQLNDDTLRHEQRHQRDARDAVAATNRRYWNVEVTGCGPDEGTARARLRERIAAKVEQARLDAFRAEQAAVAKLHAREPSQQVIDCRVCDEEGSIAGSLR